MELTELLQTSPEEGARRLVAECGDRLRNIAFRLCLDLDRADELVFRTFSRALAGMATFRSGAPLFPWLRAILVNEWRMDARRSGPSSVSEFSPDVADAGPDPAETVASLDDAAAVRAAVDRLPDNLRAAVVLRYYEDLTVPEIARALSVPEGTVKFRLHDARRRLLRTLRNLQDGTA